MKWLCFIYGCVWGSFLMAAATRYRTHQSLVFPASHCDVCQVPLRYWQLVPGVSYWLLRGRCTLCRSPIPVETVMIELAVGGLATSLTNWQSVRIILELSLWLLAALCDRATQTFPGWVSWSSLVLAAWNQPPLLWLLSALALLIIRWCWPRWPRPMIGDGDLELILCYALGHSLLQLSTWLLLACLLTLCRHLGTRTPIAFVPYLTLSAWLCWLWPQ